MICRKSSFAVKGFVLVLLVSACYGQRPADHSDKGPIRWEPVGLSGGGGMFTPAISPADPNLMMLNCDMSAAYLSSDGGTSWHRIGRQGRQTFGGYFHPKHDGWIYMTLTEGAPGPVAHPGQRANLAALRRLALLEHPARGVRPVGRCPNVRHHLRRQRLARTGRVGRQMT